MKLRVDPQSLITRARGAPAHLVAGLRAYVSRQTATGIAAALACAAAAQYLLDKKQSPGWAAGLYAAAAILFVWLHRHQALENGRAGPPASRRPLRWIWVGIAVALGALAFPRFTGNLFWPDATALWLGGLVALGVAAWSPEAEGAKPQGEGNEAAGHCRGIVLTYPRLALLGIVLVGAFYRLYRLDLIPQEMGCDLPHNYNNIRMILRQEFLIFFPSHPGREGLFFYLAAIFCRLFGLSHLTIKMSAALIGVLTLPLLYLLGKELFNREVGLYAAFFLAVSRWHIALVRMGYRASTVPPLLILTWYFLVRGIKTQRRWFFGLAGLFLGLGLYTYNAFAVVPLFVVLVLASGFLLGRGRALLANWDSVALLVIVAIYVFIPLGRYAYEEPQRYSYRAATRLTGVEAPLPQDVLGTLAGNVAGTLLMFNVRGDGAFVTNVPFARQLGFVTAMLFVLGVAYALWRWRHGDNLTVLLALIVMLLPNFLTLAFPQEVPNAIRAVGALPAATLLPALSLGAVRKRLAALYPAGAAREFRLAVSWGEATRELSWRWPWTRRHAWMAILVLALAAETYAVYPFYFTEYVNRLPYRNYSISLELARAIDDFADDGTAYIKVVPYWYDGNAVRAQLRRTDQSWHNEIDRLLPDQPPLAGPPGKVMIIVHPDDRAALQQLRQAFPKGIELTHLNYDHKVAFITFYGER